MMRRDRLVLVATLMAILSADLYFILLPKLRSIVRGSGQFCSCGHSNFTLPTLEGLATPQLFNWTLASTLTLATTTDPAHGGSKLGNLFAHPLYNIQTPPLEPEEKLLEGKQLMEYYRKKVSRWERNMKLYRELAAASNTTLTQPKVTFDPDASWLKFHLGISRYALYSRDDPAIPRLLEDMESMSIINADYTDDEKALKGSCDCTKVVKPSGHHLKLALKMKNFAKAMFKPMRQQRDDVTPEDFFYFVDFQRHNAEIAAFHLDRCSLISACFGDANASESCRAQ